MSPPRRARLPACGFPSPLPQPIEMTTAFPDKQSPPDYSRFAIGFDNRDRARWHELIDEVIDSNRWTEADFTKRFEQAWAQHNGAAAVAALELGRRRVSPPSISPDVQARRCCAPRTRSWRRRSPRFAPARKSSSSTATVRISACRSRTSRRRPSSTAEGGAPRPHRRPHRLRLRADRRLLRRERHLPDRGLRARARRELERSPAGHLRRRRRLLVVRDQDDLDRRGRRARLAPAGADRACARVPQLREAELRGRTA